MEENKYLDQLKKIILDYTTNYSTKIYLFGSRAKGISRTSSDVDIAFLPEKSLPENFIADLSEIIENSSTRLFFLHFTNLDCFASLAKTE